MTPLLTKDLELVYLFPLGVVRSAWDIVIIFFGCDLSDPLHIVPLLDTILI